MRCVICDGSGCKECNETGNFDVMKCPLLFYSREIDEILAAADLYLDHGLPVVGTCQMDQAYNFTEVCRFVRRDIAYWKNKLGIFG